jgi:hypothetical protein
MNVFGGRFGRVFPGEMEMKPIFPGTAKVQVRTGVEAES